MHGYRFKSVEAATLKGYALIELAAAARALGSVGIGTETVNGVQQNAVFFELIDVIQDPTELRFAEAVYKSLPAEADRSRLHNAQVTIVKNADLLHQAMNEQGGVPALTWHTDFQYKRLPDGIAFFRSNSPRFSIVFDGIGTEQAIGEVTTDSSRYFALPSSEYRSPEGLMQTVSHTLVGNDGHLLRGPVEHSDASPLEGRFDTHYLPEAVWNVIHPDTLHRVPRPINAGRLCVTVDYI